MLRKIPLHRFAVRHNLFMGGDRELVMLSGLMAFALVFSAMEVKAAIYGVIFWSLSLFVFRLMAKSDPQMRFVYLRHRQYKRYYPPQSTPFRTNTRTYK